MPRIKGGSYISVEDYRRIVGYTSTQPVYRAIRDGRLPGVVNVGPKNGQPYYIIPSTASIVNKTIKHGGYVGVAQQIRKAKEEYLKRQRQSIDNQ
jgi:hypothetical protein